MQAQSNELNFKGQNIYIGIDVHKKDWKVSIMSEKLEHKTFCQKPSAKDLAGYLERNFPGATYYSAYETGFCGFYVHTELLKYNIHNIVVNAADVPTSQKEKVNKTDPRDCRKIARSLRGKALTGIYIPQRKTMEDRTLIRCRYAITKDLGREKNRIKSLLNFYGIEQPEASSSNKTYWSKRYMKWLGEIKMESESGNAALMLLLKSVEQFRQMQLDVNRKIRLLSRNKAYASDFELISSIPGIALITGMTFLTEIEDMNRFSDTDHFAGYIGLIPSCHSSGQVENNGEITPRCHKFMREMLIESAWTAARIDSALHLAFCELCKRMEPNKAIIRIARKLLNRIYYVLKQKKKYVCGVVK
jgi:transposase